MDSETKSDFPPTRDAARSHSSLPGFGDGSWSGPTHTLTVNGSKLVPRRKRSTDFSLPSEANRGGDQENKPKSSVPAATSHPKSSRVAARQPLPPTTTSLSSTNTSTSAGAPKLTHKRKAISKSALQFKPFRNQSTNVENQGVPRGPRRLRVPKKPKESSPPPNQTPPTSLDVTHADVSSEHYHTFASLNELDDLARWDMDSLPSIPSPPDSPDNVPTYSNPFSTTDPDDDSLLDTDDIPFPTNRSRVVLENMGVKKFKTAAKDRNAGSRHIPSPTIPPSSPTPTITGLPPPLPPRLLSQNVAGGPNPLIDDTLPTALRRSPLLSRPLVMSASTSSGNISDSGYGSTATERKKAKKTSPGPTKSRKDTYGCIHLGAEDCVLSMTFPQTSHFEIWDMSDEGFFAIPVLLCLMAKDASAWAGMPLAMPDVSLIDIRCEDAPLPVPHNSRRGYEPSSSFTASFSGGKSATEQSALGSGMNMMSSLKKREEEQSIAKDRISLDGKWVRTYARPGVEGSRAVRQPSEPEEGSAAAYTMHSTSSAQSNLRGWYLKFWIPIPTRLFAKCETRAFRIHARVWMMGDEERVLSLDRYETAFPGEVEEESRLPDPYPLTAETEMTASHLRKERDMDGWW